MEILISTNILVKIKNKKNKIMEINQKNMKFLDETSKLDKKN